MPLLLFDEDELRQAINIKDAINAVRQAFSDLAQGKVNNPAAFYLGLPAMRGSSHVKASYLEDAPYYVVKIANTFLDNPNINLSSRNEVTTLFDAATGFPAAIMVDQGYLTQMRSGATGALAAQYLARETIEKVAIIGTGAQAYIHLKMLASVRRIPRVSVWGPTMINADTYARRLVEEHDLYIEIAASAEEAIREADLIITATPTQTPLIQAEWLKAGVHITAVGSNEPTKQELAIDVLKRADVIIADNLHRCATVGEIHHGLAAGVLSLADIQGELGDLVVGKIKGRTSPDQITVVDLTGRSVQDAAIATLALEKAIFLGLGHRLS